MKPEELIKLLKDPKDRSGNDVDMGSVMETIIQALEKQVARKPIWEGPHNEAKDDAMPHCRVCDTELEEDWKGCPDCLTPIDWRDEK